MTSDEIRQKAREWRIAQRTYPAQRGTNALSVMPEQFDEALTTFAEFLLSRGAVTRRMMRLPKNLRYPNYEGIHPEDDWCAKAGCTPVCGAGAAPPAVSPQPTIQANQPVLEKFFNMRAVSGGQPARQMSALERFIVVLAACCGKNEITRLRKFFQEWEREKGGKQ